jgi:hypothetical protein
VKHCPRCFKLGKACHCGDAQKSIPDPDAAERRQDVEAFLLTLPGWLIDPDAMVEILALLHKT